MITGIVTSDHRATIRLHIEDDSGATQAIDVVIDTGFTDFLSLPIAVIARLGLPFVRRQQVELADGNAGNVSVHTGVIIWEGRPRRIDVHAMGSQQLIGMGLLVAHDLHIRVTDGGTVSIDAIP